MGILQIPFLVSDLDGTLLSSSKQISKVNQTSLAQFRSMGGQFTIATGRTYFEAARFIQQMDVQIPVILCNGAMIYDPAHHQYIPVHTLSRNLMMDIIHELQTFLPSSIDIFAYSKDWVYATKVGKITTSALEGDDSELRFKMISSFEQLPHDATWIKVVCIGNDEEMKQLIQWAETKKELPLEFIPSSDNYFEILPQGVSKGNALLQLIEKIDLTPEQTAAIGDHCNDLSMLGSVGLSAAVSNAHPSVLQQAKITVPSNNAHGVSHLVHNHLITVTKNIF